MPRERNRAPELPCARCGKPEWVHESVPQGHEFTREVPQENAPAFPFDPVLRQALIDKGILMVEDLEAAAETIRKNSIIFGKEMQNGPGT